jgi:hypothetical protein
MRVNRILVLAILCSNFPGPPTPSGVQPCPDPAEPVIEVVTATDGLGSRGKRIHPGALEELIAAIRDGKAYVDVQSTARPTGEIGARIVSEREHGTR